MTPSESPPLTDTSRSLVAIAGDDDRTVVWLVGEHDISTVVALSETMSRAIAIDDADLVIDLSGVQFMDAATVGVIVRTRVRLRLRSRTLSLRSPSRSARRILDLCGLADLVDPLLLDATAQTATAGALSSWVAVPARDRAERHVDASPPKPRRAKDPVFVVQDERAANVANSAGP